MRDGDVLVDKPEIELLSISVANGAAISMSLMREVKD